MCEGSIHAKHRRAKDKERLMIDRIPGHGGYKGYYEAGSTAGSARLLVCVRGSQKALIKKVTLERGASPLLGKYEGKRNVPVTLKHLSSGDYVQFDGTQYHLSVLAIGTRIDIGIPVKKRAPKAAGIVAIEKAIKQAIASGEGEKPVEPAEQPAEQQPKPAEQPKEPAEQPAQQPEPAQPQARRLRKVRA